MVLVHLGGLEAAWKVLLTCIYRSWYWNVLAGQGLGFFVHRVERVGDGNNWRSSAFSSQTVEPYRFMTQVVRRGSKLQSFSCRF